MLYQEKAFTQITVFKKLKVKGRSQSVPLVWPLVKAVVDHITLTVHCGRGYAMKQARSERDSEGNLYLLITIHFCGN